MSTRQGNPEAPTRVLVLDQHDATRLGHVLLLQRLPWVELCVPAPSRDRALALTERYRPHVALVDVSSLGYFVGVLTQALRDVHPPMRVVLTARCPNAAKVSLEQAGAVGFVPAGARAPELIAAVHAAARSEPLVPVPAPRGLVPALTEREHEVLTLLVTGATNREIAEQLHLGPDSIKKYATAVYRKLGVRNRTEATRRAAEIPLLGQA